MNNSWVKLYRKVNDKGLMKDHLAYILFNWILINVDRNTGSMKLGRYRVCDELGINPSTYYKVLQRLEKKWHIISTQSTNKWTTVCVDNWGKYQNQENIEGKQQVTDVEFRENESNTLQELENTRIREGEKEASSPKYLLNIPEHDMDKFTQEFTCLPGQVREKARSLHDYCEARGKRYKNYRAFLRNAIRKDFGERKKSINEAEKYEIDPNGIARLRELKSDYKLKGMN